MYWLYLLIFITVVMVPDIFKDNFLGMSHERVEEVAIFLLGSFGILLFIFKEKQIALEKKEKEKEQRRLQQTAKDLIESYSYIGEINRKMDLLMQIGMGLSDRTNLTEKHEKDIYRSITESATFLLKAECATLVFFDITSKRVIKHICHNDKCGSLDKNPELFSMEEDVFMKQVGESIIFCSHKIIDNVRGYVIVKTFDDFQAKDNNNQEIIKYLSDQALMLYSYIVKNPINKK